MCPRSDPVQARTLDGWTMQRRMTMASSRQSPTQIPRSPPSVLAASKRPHSTKFGCHSNANQGGQNDRNIGCAEFCYGPAQGGMCTHHVGRQVGVGELNRVSCTAEDKKRRPDSAEGLLQSERLQRVTPIGGWQGWSVTPAACHLYSQCVAPTKAKAKANLTAGACKTPPVQVSCAEVRSANDEC